MDFGGLKLRLKLSLLLHQRLAVGFVGLHHQKPFVGAPFQVARAVQFVARCLPCGEG